jgi:hypothetical protein
MPELSRFFGIIIRMYAEPFAQHHRPHFHAYYGESVAVYALDPLELISGPCRFASSGLWKRGPNFIWKS